MWTIFKKEVNLFLSSLIAYIAIAVFLLGTGLFVWVFPDYSVISYGYASLDSFFSMAPYIFLFLIPAITMRSFSEEIQTGTIELLVTRRLKIGRFCWANILRPSFWSFSPFCLPSFISFRFMSWATPKEI